MAMSDDDVIRRRLLIEGDGGWDDRRIAALFRTFVKWCSSLEDTPEESNAQLQKILLQLAQCEIGMEKTEAVCKMNELEQTNYEEIFKKIDQEIVDAKNKIGECKIELQQAKRIRKNRQEYDALARKIMEHPDREETMKKLESLNEEMNSLKAQRQSLEEKLDLRRKQFHVLISSIHEMQRILEADDLHNESREDGDVTDEKSDKMEAD